MFFGSGTNTEFLTKNTQKFRVSKLLGRIIRSALGSRQRTRPAGIGSPPALIQPGCLEVTGVPGVCHIAGAGGVVQEQGDFPIRIAAAYTVHILKIGAVHAYEEVVVGIILSGELTGGVARTGDAVLGQLASGRWIDGIADLLAAGGGGGNMELVGQSGLLHQVLHNKFGHGAAVELPWYKKALFIIIPILYTVYRDTTI